MSLIYRLYQALYPTTLPKSTSPLKFGILGAANIAPNALLTPAKSHPDVVVYAVAARKLERAKEFARKHGIEKAYGSYQELLDDPAVDVVYNPLPNMLHYEWTMKALAAGKHVLNEKPSADTAEETRQMFEFAEKKGLVLLDAYHYRFHPALARAKEIVDSKQIGKITKASARMILFSGIVGEGDIRYDYGLGGGALMDCGCYVLNCVQFMLSQNPESVTEAKSIAYKHAENVDRRTEATLAFPEGVTAKLTVDLAAPNKYGVIPELAFSFKIEGELGTVEMSNFVMPTMYHTIKVKIHGGASRTEKVYKPKDGGEGEEWWTTYRYQLGAMVDKVRGREPLKWVSKEESVATMEWIEKMYEKNGMGSRPKSAYVAADII